MNNSVKQTEFAQRSTDLCCIFKGAVLESLVVNEYRELAVLGCSLSLLQLDWPCSVTEWMFYVRQEDRESYYESQNLLDLTKTI